MSVPAPLTLFATGLSCARGGETVFAGLDFSLSGGQALILRGPNGAGKSSALLALAGQIPLAGGTLAWGGLDPEARPGAHMHFVGHAPAVKSSLTARENLAFWCALYGGDRGGVAASLAAAGLGGLGELEAGILSAGQVRRLALARLLVAPRPVWLLDEPTSALDDAGARWIGDLLTRHLDEGGMAILATHLDLGIEADPRVETLLLAGRSA